jgi:hypothetical protein
MKDLNTLIGRILFNGLTPIEVETITFDEDKTPIVNDKYLLYSLTRGAVGRPSANVRRTIKISYKQLVKDNNIASEQERQTQLEVLTTYRKDNHNRSKAKRLYLDSFPSINPPLASGRGKATSVRVTNNRKATKGRSYTFVNSFDPTRIKLKEPIIRLIGGGENKATKVIKYKKLPRAKYQKKFVIKNVAE